MAGTARGRSLRCPDGPGTRPTADRVREAVFNALFSRGPMTGRRVADLFAGSGALGIEALSRGAAQVWFVESDRAAAAAIEDNLETLGFSDRATVVERTVDEGLAQLGDDLDFVLVDPPYAFDHWENLVERLEPHLGAEAVVVIESDRAVPLPDRWTTVRARTYGSTVVTFAVPPAASTTRRVISPGVDA